MRNIAVFLTYEGTAYHGWQMQKNLATVQQTLEKAIAMVVGHDVHVTGCGRTDAGGHARRLMAVYYLITGECYHPMIRCEPIRFGSWCTALRQIYHEEACNGYNYERAADETTDPCLSKLLQELSADEYHHAEILMTMLERSMRGN